MRQAVVRVALTVALLLGACAGEASSPPAPQATEPVEVPEGWRTFDAPGFRLSLPARFEGGDKDAVEDLIRESAEGLSPGLRSQLEAVLANDLLVLFLFDTEATGDFVTNVSSVRIPGVGNRDVEELLRLTVENYERRPEFSIQEQGVREVRGTRVAAVEMIANFSGSRIYELIYLFLDGSEAISVTYAERPEKFEALRREFERSAETFELT